MREENQTIIKALNMFGRVPEQYELLNEIERLKEENRTYQEYPFIIVEKNGVICRKNQEIERLNNIINELEKYIKENSWYYNTSDGCQWVNQFKVLDKLKELKESDNNE